ncbi:MAG TPA: RNA polymerase sigma factor [Casimicrobiaceae bacterium]|nr:RNA polymerase sigma factor [Casimicrobiaceae bacterium]
MDDIERIKRELVELLPRLRRFARHLTRHVADADDVLQVALEKALGRLDQWQRGTRLDSWMFTIVRNTWLDEVRSRARRDDHAPLDEHAEVAAPDFATDEAMAIQQALSRLPEEQSTCLMLVLVEGLSYKEAAAVLEIPIGTVTSRLARGREALQAVLGPQAG